MQNRIRSIGQHVHEMIQEAEAFGKELAQAEKDIAEKELVSEEVEALRKKAGELNQTVSSLEAKKAGLERAIDAIRAKLA